MARGSHDLSCIRPDDQLSKASIATGRRGNPLNSVSHSACCCCPAAAVKHDKQQVRRYLPNVLGSERRTARSKWRRARSWVMRALEHSRTRCFVFRHCCYATPVPDKQSIEVAYVATRHKVLAGREARDEVAQDAVPSRASPLHDCHEKNIDGVVSRQPPNAISRWTRQDACQITRALGAPKRDRPAT